MIPHYSGVAYFTAAVVVILTAIVMFFYSRQKNATVCETNANVTMNSRKSELETKYQAESESSTARKPLIVSTEDAKKITKLCDKECKNLRGPANGDSNCEFIEDKSDGDVIPCDQPVMRCPFSGLAMPGLADFHGKMSNTDSCQSRALSDPVEYMEHIQGEVKRIHSKAAERSIEATMTEDQKKQERQIQQEQMEAIFKLMREQEEVFGINSIDDMKQQMKLYM